jgi:very-short-patch-repair endonuclease/DNA-directed RNA polymerase subunit RPC12/RpoP
MRCSINKEVFKQEYPLLGPKEFSKKYNLNRSTIRNWGWKLQIRYNAPKKKLRFCNDCGKQISSYQKLKRQLCRNCSAKINYINRGIFTHNHGKLWKEIEVQDLKDNYYNNTKEDLCYALGRNWSSILHKAQRLKLVRNPKFTEEGNKKGRETMKLNNPMLNPETRERATNSLKNLYKEHPEKLLNSKLKRNQMTLIEKKMSELLDSLNINYEWNKYVRTKNTWRFPDFKINNKNLIIECDGLYWHKENKIEDEIRQKELEAIGYKVIRFTDEEILKNIDSVKNNILKEVSVHG